MHASARKHSHLASQKHARAAALMHPPPRLVYQGSQGYMGAVPKHTRACQRPYRWSSGTFVDICARTARGSRRLATWPRGRTAGWPRTDWACTLFSPAPSPRPRPVQPWATPCESSGEERAGLAHSRIAVPQHAGNVLAEPVGTRLSREPRADHRVHQAGQGAGRNAPGRPRAGDSVSGDEGGVACCSTLSVFCLQRIRSEPGGNAAALVCTALTASPLQCFDHFLEGDTVLHSWEVLCELLRHVESRGIMCDVGM